jgi:hypothetical protein
MIDDKIFISLAFELYEVTPKDIALFLEALDQQKMPDSFYFETKDAIFKINKIKREFRVIARKPQKDFEKSLDSDLTIMAMYKTAKMSGYKCFLETKYMN